MTRIEECILYRDFEEDEVLKVLPESLRRCRMRRLFPTWNPVGKMFYDGLNRLVEMANRYGFSGNLWCNYLTYLLVNKENAFSTSCEIVGRWREASTRWRSMIYPLQRAVLTSTSGCLTGF